MKTKKFKNKLKQKGFKEYEKEEPMLREKYTLLQYIIDKGNAINVRVFPRAFGAGALDKEEIEVAIYKEYDGYISRTLFYSFENLEKAIEVINNTLKIESLLNYNKEK